MSRFVDSDATAWTRDPAQVARLRQHDAWQRGDDVPNPFATRRKEDPMHTTSTPAYRKPETVDLGSCRITVGRDLDTATPVATRDYANRRLLVRVVQHGPRGYRAVASTHDGRVVGKGSDGRYAVCAFQAACASAGSALDAQ